jgi:hypothetical protein
MGAISCSRPKSWAVGLLSCFAFLLITPLGNGSAAAAAADDPFPLERLFNFGPDGTGATGFESVDSIALDQQSEYVYVLDRSGSAGTLLKFGPDGEPIDFAGTSPYIEGNRITGLEPSAGPEGSAQIAVDPLSGVIYVTEMATIRALEANGEPAEFTAGPGAGTSEIPGFSEPISVAVDGNGSIYVSDISGQVSIFDSTGAPLTSFSVSNPTSIGVDSNGAVYVQQGEQAISRFTPEPFPVTDSTTYTEAPFVATTIPDSFLRGFDVDASNNDVYVLETNFTTSWIQRYDVAANLVESFGAPGSSTEDSALEGTSEAVAAWEQGKEIAEGEAVKLYAGDRGRAQVAALGRRIIIGPPEVANTSALDVTADSAKLRAWVDPNTAETTYHFEYGLKDCALAGSACISVPFPDASVGAGERPVEVSHSIFGLQPDTTYYFRVLAKNSLGPTVEGPSRTFRTQRLGVGFKLPDSRVWEMVSPSDKFDALLRGTWGGRIQAASDGEGLAYLALGAIETDPQGNRMSEFASILAQRGPNGWHSQDISSPNNEAVSVGLAVEGEFKLFSSDLSRGVLMPRGSTLLSPQATERTPYLRQHGDPPVYTPLVTGKEGVANVPPGTKFGGDPDNTIGAVVPLGATPDLNRVVLRSSLDVPLVAGLPSPTPSVIYLWTAGQLQPISVLPVDEGGSLAAGPSFGSGVTSVQNAISTDGSRVFWGQLAENDGGALFMRDTTAEQTVRLDAPQGGTGAGGATPVFQGASADGTVVFFTDSRQLTPDASSSGRDLYRCEIPAGSPAAGCANLTNLSVPLAPGDSGRVLDLVSGLGEDGASIYFTARGVLDDAPNPYGDSAVAGEPNLYHWEEGEGVRFIATLADEDKGVWGRRGSISAAAGALRAAAVSPDGRYLLFMSQRSLTGYDNLEVTSGKPVQEVFRHDAVTGDLDCVSCDPSGAAPEAEEPVGRRLINPGPTGPMYGGLQVAATLPAGYRNEEGLPLYRARTALDNGRVFFNAFDSLVPADSNGEWDVYQWEPIGVGSCDVASGDAATVRSAGGCVSLLSSGTAEEEAGFFDASVSGDDVFFLTPARLSVADVDDAPDVYDARVGGVEATFPPTPPDCQGEACRSFVVPPGDLSPGSATFQGLGNPKPSKGKRCPKGKRKVRAKGKVRCVRKSRQVRKNRQSQKRAGQNRRAVR